MDYEFDFGVVFDNAGVLLQGALLTLELSAASMLAGLVIAGIVLGMGGARVAAIRGLATGYVEVIRNTPFLLQLYFFFFALPNIGIRLGPNTAAFVALSMNAGAYSAEILRGGIAAVHLGQWEAGYALGLRRFQIFRLVVLKPAVRAIYPAVTGQFILLLLTSSVVAAISATDLTQAAQTLDSTTFRSFEIYLTVTVLYLVMSLSFSLLFRRLEHAFLAYPTR